MNNLSTKKPKISIVIPVYNSEKELDRCLASIYAQTFTDYEIVLVNDGSTDGSLALCRAYAEKDPRITVVDQENKGSGPARNAGIDASSGEYVYFCDSDDEIAPNLLERTCSVAEEKGVDLVVFSIHGIIEDSQTGMLIREYNTTQENSFYDSKESFRSAFPKLYYEGVLFGAPYNKLFRADVIKENAVRFPELRRGQDEVFNMRYYRYTGSCAVIPDSLYTYFQFDNAGKNKKYRLSYFETTTKTYYQTLKTLLDEFGADDEYSQQKFQNSFVYSMESALLLAYNPVEKLNRAEKIEFFNKVLQDEFIVSTEAKITKIPQGYERFWSLFVAKDARALYRFFKKAACIEKIKAPLRKIRDALRLKK